jgi:hypothetical protein
MDILDGVVGALMLIVFLPVAAIVAVGAALAMTGGGPRSRRDYPSCGRCRFNLAGTLGQSDTCPECGTSIGVAGVCPVRSKRSALSGPVGVTIAVVVAIAMWLLVFIGG